MIGFPGTVLEDGNGVRYVVEATGGDARDGRPDGYLIRRRAVDAGIPLITDLQLARAIIEALRWRRPESLQVVAWNDYLNRAQTTLL